MYDLWDADLKTCDTATSIYKRVIPTHGSEMDRQGKSRRKAGVSFFKIGFVFLESPFLKWSFREILKNKYNFGKPRNSYGFLRKMLGCLFKGSGVVTAGVSFFMVGFIFVNYPYQLKFGKPRNSYGFLRKMLGYPYGNKEMTARGNLS